MVEETTNSLTSIEWIRKNLAWILLVGTWILILVGGMRIQIPIEALLGLIFIIGIYYTYKFFNERFLPVDVEGVRRVAEDFLLSQRRPIKRNLNLSFLDKNVVIRQVPQTMVWLYGLIDEGISLRIENGRVVDAEPSSIDEFQKRIEESELQRKFPKMSREELLRILREES